MTERGPYRALVRSIYALHGENGEFLAALARPWGETVYAKEAPEEGTLARIPRALEIREAIAWCREAIAEERSFYQEELYGSRCEFDGLSTAAINYIRGLQADIAQLEAELEAL